MSYVLALFSSVLWGGADFFGGILSRRLPALAVVGATQAAGLVAITGWALATGAVDDPRGWLPWSIAAGLAGSAALAAFYAALAGGTMGVVSPIAALGALLPLGVGLASGERPSLLQVVGALVAVAGAVLSSGPELRGRAGARPVLLAAGAGAGFGVVLVLIDRGAAYSPAMTLTGMRVTSVTCFAVLAVLTRGVGGLRPADLPLLVTVGVGDVAANLCYGIATTRGLVSLTAVLGSLYPVMTVLLARWLLHERLTRVQQLGCVTALGGVALVAGGG